jgi:hypothetical protein
MFPHASHLESHQFHTSRGGCDLQLDRRWLESGVTDRPFFQSNGFGFNNMRALVGQPNTLRTVSGRLAGRYDQIWSSGSGWARGGWPCRDLKAFIAAPSACTKLGPEPIWLQGDTYQFLQYCPRRCTLCTPPQNQGRNKVASALVKQKQATPIQPGRLITSGIRQGHSELLPSAHDCGSIADSKQAADDGHRPSVTPCEQAFTPRNGALPQAT